MDNTLADLKFLWLYKGLVLIATLKKMLTSPTRFLCAVYSKLYPNSSLYCSLKHSYQCLWIYTRELITRCRERGLLFSRRCSASTPPFGVQNLSNYARVTVSFVFSLLLNLVYLLGLFIDQTLSMHVYYDCDTPLSNSIFLPPCFISFL